MQIMSSSLLFLYARYLPFLLTQKHCLTALFCITICCYDFLHACVQCEVSWLHWLTWTLPSAVFWVVIPLLHINIFGHSSLLKSICGSGSVMIAMCCSWSVTWFQVTSAFCIERSSILLNLYFLWVQQGALHSGLVDAIRPHLPALRNSPYGKRILSRTNPKKWNVACLWSFCVIDDLQAHHDRRWMIRGWAVFCRGGNGIISQACGIACPVALTVWTI